MSLPRFLATRVERRLLGGNSSPVVVETAGGLFVAKLRGAGHGVWALVAEIIVAELAGQLGLSVPERVLVDVPTDVESVDRNDELADLLARSAGLNLGFRFLDGAQQPSTRYLHSLDEEFIARVLWLDGLVMNPDRTESNPNILGWKNRPWLIDHGSALGFHHDWPRVTEDSPREWWSYENHVFMSRLSLLERFDAVLAPMLSAPVLDAAMAMVPDEFLTAIEPGHPPAHTRAAYHAFLWKRLRTPRPFVDEAESET